MITSNLLTDDEVELVFTDDVAAEQWLFYDRWQDGLECPYCLGSNIRAAKQPKGRKNQLFYCRPCRRNITIWTGTALEQCMLRPSVVAKAVIQFHGWIDKVTVPHMSRELGISWRSAEHLKYRLERAEANHWAWAA